MAKKQAEETPETRVQRQVDEEIEKGYFGYSPDPTPRENYTIAGVTSGKPTPETDEKLADEAGRNITGRA